jgi:hypothetical protein
MKSKLMRLRRVASGEKSKSDDTKHDRAQGPAPISVMAATATVTLSAAITSRCPPFEAFADATGYDATGY